MRTIVLAGALIGAAVADGAGPANLNIIIHRRHRTVTAMAGKPGTAAHRVIRCRAATVRRIEVPADADGVLGTAVRRATPSKAVVAHPIKVRSADRGADGMATELTRTRVQRYPVVRLSRRNFATENSCFRCSSGGRCGDGSQSRQLKRDH